jgi:hypothetical protein
MLITWLLTPRNLGLKNLSAAAAIPRSKMQMDTKNRLMGKVMRVGSITFSDHFIQEILQN